MTINLHYYYYQIKMMQLNKSERLNKTNKVKEISFNEDEEPSIRPPSMKKKKGVTINEMLQNDLETEDEKLIRYRQTQLEEKERVTKLLMDKNQGIEANIMQVDDEEVLRYNYQLKVTDDSNEYNDLSQNQEFIRDPLQNDLAMLEDDSYIGAKESNAGGFNDYSSMKRNEIYMNESRPSSSPRNNMMRTYDSQAMTQQFNYGFNYNTSGGGNEDQSQNSQLANSGYVKLDRESIHQIQYLNSDISKAESIIIDAKAQEFQVDILQDQQQEELTQHLLNNSDYQQPANYNNDTQNIAMHEEDIESYHNSILENLNSQHENINIQIQGPEEFKESAVGQQHEQLEPSIDLHSPKNQTPKSYMHEQSIDYEDPPIYLAEDFEDQVSSGNKSENDEKATKILSHEPEKIDQLDEFSNHQYNEESFVEPDEDIQILLSNRKEEKNIQHDKSYESIDQIKSQSHSSKDVQEKSNLQQEISNTEDVIYQGSENLNQIEDFEEGSDFGNSISHRDSLQQSSDTIKHMFDALNYKKFRYQCMSKRNLQIEIPENEYSEDDHTNTQISQLNKEEIQEELAGEIQLINNSDEISENELQQIDEYEEQQKEEDTEDSHSEQIQQPSQNEQEENYEEQEVQQSEKESEHDNLSRSESPHELDIQESPKNSSPSQEEIEEQQNQEQHSENDLQDQTEYESEKQSKHEPSKLSSSDQQSPKDQDQPQLNRSIIEEHEEAVIDLEHEEEQMPIQSQNESLTSDHQQMIQIDSQQFQEEQQLSHSNSPKHSQSSNNSFQSERVQSHKEEIYESPQIHDAVPSPLNQPEVNDEKDYSIEDYVAEQQDLETRHRLLNNDMYNLLREEPPEDSYKSPKHHQQSTSSNNEGMRRNDTEDQQFFYRGPNAEMDSENQDHQMNNGDDDQNYLSSGGNFHMPQQQHEDHYNEDNDDIIGKWELEKKENDINEIESLDFTVKREDFPDHQYQSNNDQSHQHADENPLTQPEQPKVESMHIYVSPEKEESRELFDRKRDSKSRTINPPPLPPSSESTKPILKSNTSIKQKQVQEKKSIKKIKDLFNSEEKYQLYERLYSKETSASQRKRKAFEEDSAKKNSSASKNVTLRPKPDANHKNISMLDETKASNKTIDPCVFLYHKGIQLREQKKKEQEQQQQLIESEALKACTFKPNLTKSTIETLSIERPQTSMYERNQYWNLQRQRKIQEEQEKIKDQELDECSFAPKIQAHSLLELRSARQDADYQYDSVIGQNNVGKSQRSSRSRNNKAVYLQTTQTLTQERSVKVYIERQERAKQQKLEKNNVFLKNNGSNWKNEVTKPKPPKITDIIISNLQRKLNHNFNKGDQQQYQSWRKLQKEPHISKGGSRNQLMTQQHSREGSVLGGVDQDIMIFDDEVEVASAGKRGGPPKNIQFKEQVKFLRQALHQLNLDE